LPSVVVFPDPLGRKGVGDPRGGGRAEVRLDQHLLQGIEAFLFQRSRHQHLGDLLGHLFRAA